MVAARVTKATLDVLAVADPKPRVTKATLEVLLGPTTASAVSSDAGGSYVVRAQVVADAPGTFDVIGAVTADAPGAFVVSAPVAADAPGSYAVAQAVFGSAALAWTVGGPVHADALGDYSVRAAASADALAAYGVAGTVSSSSPSATWNVASMVRADAFGLSYIGDKVTLPSTLYGGVVSKTYYGVPRWDALSARVRCEDTS